MSATIPGAVGSIGIPARPYSTMRDGLTIANCDNEPVQTPGCIQAHGVLLVLRPADSSILQVSDNAEAVLGQSAVQLLGRSVSVVIGEDGHTQLLDMLAKEPTDRNPMYLSTLPARTADTPALDVTVHTIDGLVILEFEATGRSNAATPDYYALVKKTVARLQTAGSLQGFCDLVAEEIRKLTGLDRVMVYKFHADGHGEVFAESKRGDLSSWRGLHYPAEDIPKPAREIFAKTWIRPVPDVSSALSELVPLANPETGQPLNMSFCALRGVSVMYTEYLRNMQVAAALTMAIRRGEQLWGLIACHHYAGPRQIPHQIRAACEFLAQVVSLQHQAAEDKEQLAYRLNIDSVHERLIAATAREGGLLGLVTGTPSLLAGIDAGGVALYHLDRWWCVGRTPAEDELTELGDWLTEFVLPASVRALYETDRLVQAYPAAAAFSAVASGLLAMPASPDRRDLLLWFRPETIHTVDWGGNPHDKPTIPGPNGLRLTPRRSFELFTESVRQRSLPWKPVEVEAAARLRLLISELAARPADQRTVLHDDLARSNEELDAFAYVASHDLKEPLRGIHRYAHQLLEDATTLNAESRPKLDGLMRLTLRMDSLLDSMLHFSRVGGSALRPERVDLNEVLAEALDFVGSRTNDNTHVAVPRPLPTIQCDRIRCRQIMANLLSNALKYTDASRKQIEVGYIAADECHARPGYPQGMQNQTIYYVSDNGIGIQPKHFDQVFKLFKRLHGQDSYGGGSGAGLTIVRKLVAQHGGRVWVDSVAGHGSVFYFTLRGKT